MPVAPPAMILGLGENGYGILRGLVRAGVSVTGFYAGPEESGRYSKHCETQAGASACVSWLRSIARARSYAWFDWRDPIPFVRATADLLTSGFRNLSKILLDRSPPVPVDAVAVHPDHGAGATR